jgi:hypothetical protein
MGGRCEAWGYVCLAAFGFVLFPAAARPAFSVSEAVPAGQELASFSVRIADEEQARAVRNAVAGAFDRLADSRCQEIFGAFRDTSGRPLQERLDLMGITAQNYLRLVLFYDGAHLAACRPNGARTIFAVTTPGSRAVFICGPQFRKQHKEIPFKGEATILHETLHSLGLGENPPSSDEITWRVVGSCAR